MTRVAESLRPLLSHPLVRAAVAGGVAVAQAAEATASVEATLARVRRLADREPPQAFARTVALAVHEMRVVTARYSSRDVESWRARVMHELGGLLFVHVDGAEIEVRVSRDPRLVRRDGGG